MHKRFRILLGAAVVLLLSTFFSLIPNGEASAASKLPTSLDGVNRVECINNVQVTGSMSVYYVQYFNLFDSNGNRTNGNGPLGTPSEYYINDNKTSCGEVMSTLFLNVGGVSGDFETVCNSAGGNCEAVRNSANIAVNVVTIDNLRYEGDLDFTFTATIRTNSPDQLPSVSDITTSATVRIDNFWAGTKTISGITHSCSQASGANQYSCTGSFDVRSSLSAQEIQNLRDNGGTVSLTVRAGSASDNATNSFNPDETNPGGPGTVVPGNPDGTDDAVREVTCDLGPFGWALCPLISTIDSMLGGVYEWVENNFLQIDVAFYQVNGGTYRAWEIFRNIANILFVIFFLVVIFSQLTSVGISNYGIKKMLPEIITAAILINLSFFIAQAMVDLSNIVGFQVKSLLEFIAASIQTGTPEAAMGTGLIAKLVSYLAIPAAVISIGAILMGGLGALLAAALLFLLSAVVAVLMLFLLLVARQIGIIIFIALAPLAFAARILPSTQGIFRSWWKMFTSLLVVYPACGLVIGAGKLAGIIIVEAGNISEPITAGIAATVGSVFGSGGSATILAAVGPVVSIVAMIAMIAPYFAVITIIKGSLKGLGAIGGAITAKTLGAGNAMQRNMNKAPGLRNMQNYVDSHRNARAAGIKAKMNAANNKRMADTDGGKMRKAIAGTALGKKLGISDQNVFGRMQETEYAAKQDQEKMAMVSVGEGKNLTGHDQKINRANAVRLGIYKAGNAAYDTDAAAVTAGKYSARNLTKGARDSRRNARDIAADPDGYLASQQFQAQTAGVAAEAKEAKKYDDSFASKTADQDVVDTVWDSGTGRFKPGISAMQTERAIADLIRRGNVDKAAQLTRDFTKTAAYRGDTNAQKRLASVLIGAKGKSNVLNAYGKATSKALSRGAAAGFSFDDMGAANAAATYTYTDSSGTHTTTADLSQALKDDYTAADIASSDKDDFTLMSSLGASYSPKQYADALSSVASTKKISEISSSITPTMKPNVAAQFTGSQVNKLSNEAYNVVKDGLSSAQYADALTSGATTEQITRMNTDLSANPAKMMSTAQQVTAHQMDNISESTFLEMANTKLRTSAGYTGPDFTTLDDLNTHLASVPNAQGFDQMSSLFSSAHAAGTANADVTKHWNTKMKDAIGL